MAKCLVGATGGLSAADKAKLIPENIREGITIAKVTGNLHAKCAVCMGYEGNGTARMKYILSSENFLTLSNYIATIRKAGNYLIYAYAASRDPGGTHTARQLKITVKGAATVIKFTEVSVLQGYAKWEGKLNVGDTIYAEWQQDIKNGIGSPSLAVSIAMI